MWQTWEPRCPRTGKREPSGLPWAIWADGGTTSTMRKEAAKAFLPSRRTGPTLRRGHGQVAISGKGRLLGGPPFPCKARAVTSTTESFAASRPDGSVVTWGGHPGPELKSIFSICATETTFAALRDDGTVIVWSCGEEGRVGLEHPALDVRADDFAFYITDVYGQ
ncbi:rbcG, partial [Symbiodinium sp. CCMP2592]